VTLPFAIHRAAWYKLLAYGNGHRKLSVHYPPTGGAQRRRHRRGHAHLLQNGETVDSILVTCFPDLTKAQVYECLAYYEDHRAEINLLVAEQMVDPNA